MSVKNPPWAPQSLLPLSAGSLTIHAKPAAKKLSKAAPASLTAAATRITRGPNTDRVSRTYRTSVAGREWQEEILAAASQIGELHYIATTTAHAASRAWIYPVDAKPQADSTQRNTPYATPNSDSAPEEDGAPPGAVDAALVNQIAYLWVLIGEAYLVEIPRRQGRPATGAPERESYVYAPMQVRFTDTTVILGADQNGLNGQEYPLAGNGAAKVTRIHRPDPRNPNEPDSAARAARPVLRQIMALMMHTDAITDSRLAGSGVFGYPADAEVTKANGQPAANLGEALVEAATSSISDRESASAVAPIFVGIPPGTDGTVKDKLVWVTRPDSGLDQSVVGLIDLNIRRLALAMDAPPEVLLGTKGVSHFGAWAIDSEYIRLQIAPLLKTIAQALSVAYETDYLFDTSPLTVRPNKAVEAQALYDRGELSGASLRAASGFTEEDAPNAGVSKDVMAHEKAMSICLKTGSLLQNPGLPAIEDQVRISMGLTPKYADYYPGKEKAPLIGATPPGAGLPGGEGESPKNKRPVSDGSPEGGADGKPHPVPGTT
jgi:hypothetical protein